MPKPLAVAQPDQGSAVTDIGRPVVQQGMLAAALAAPPFPVGSWVEQLGEGVAVMLDASGEGRAWQYPVAGGAIGMVLGVVRFAEAKDHGDTAGMKEGALKLVLGGLGVVTGSGLLSAHPTLQAGLESFKTVLGSVTFPSPVPAYGICAEPVPRRPLAGGAAPSGDLKRPVGL